MNPGKLAQSILAALVMLMMAVPALLPARPFLRPGAGAVRQEL